MGAVERRAADTSPVRAGGSEKVEIFLVAYSAFYMVYGASYLGNRLYSFRNWQEY